MKTYKKRMNLFYYETWNVSCFWFLERNFQTYVTCE